MEFPYIDEDIEREQILSYCPNSKKIGFIGIKVNQAGKDSEFYEAELQGNEEIIEIEVDNIIKEQYKWFSLYNKKENEAELISETFLLCDICSEEIYYEARDKISILKKLIQHRYDKHSINNLLLWDYKYYCCSCRTTYKYQSDLYNHLKLNIHYLYKSQERVRNKIFAQKDILNKIQEVTGFVQDIANRRNELNNSINGDSFNIINYNTIFKLLKISEIKEIKRDNGYIISFSINAEVPPNEILFLERTQILWNHFYIMSGGRNNQEHDKLFDLIATCFIQESGEKKGYVFFTKDVIHFKKLYLLKDLLGKFDFKYSENQDVSLSENLIKIHTKNV